MTFPSPSRNPSPEGRKPDSNCLLMNFVGVTSATHLGGLGFERNPCVSQLCPNIFHCSEGGKEQHFLRESLLGEMCDGYKMPRQTRGSLQARM